MEKQYIFRTNDMREFDTLNEALKYAESCEDCKEIKQLNVWADDEFEEDKIVWTRKNKLQEGTANFGILINFPLLVFDILTDEKEAPNICILSEEEFKQLEQDLIDFNQETKEIAWDIENDDDSINLEDIELEIEPGYYEGAYINVKYEDNFDVLSDKVKQEQLIRFKDFFKQLKKKYHLTELKIAYKFNNGETGYTEVNETFYWNSKEFKELRWFKINTTKYEIKDDEWEEFKKFLNDNNIKNDISGDILYFKVDQNLGNKLISNTFINKNDLRRVSKKEIKDRVLEEAIFKWNPEEVEFTKTIVKSPRGELQLVTNSKEDLKNKGFGLWHEFDFNGKHYLAMSKDNHAIAIEEACLKEEVKKHNLSLKHKFKQNWFNYYKDFCDLTDKEVEQEYGTKEELSDTATYLADLYDNNKKIARIMYANFEGMGDWAELGIDVFSSDDLINSLNKLGYDKSGVDLNTDYTLYKPEMKAIYNKEVDEVLMPYIKAIEDVMNGKEVNESCLKEENILGKKLGQKLLPKQEKKKPRYVYEIYWFDTEDCKGDPIFKKFMSKKLAKQWIEQHKEDKDKFNISDIESYNVNESCKKESMQTNLDKFVKSPKEKSIKVKQDSKKVEVEIPDKSEVGEEGHPIQKGLKGRVGKLEGLKEGVSASDNLLIQAVGYLDNNPSYAYITRAKFSKSGDIQIGKGFKTKADFDKAVEEINNKAKSMGEEVQDISVMYQGQQKNYYKYIKNESLNEAEEEKKDSVYYCLSDMKMPKHSIIIYGEEGKDKLLEIAPKYLEYYGQAEIFKSVNGNQTTIWRNGELLVDESLKESLSENIKNWIIEEVQLYFETGHGVVEDYDEFKQIARENDFRPSKEAYNYYQELLDYGPEGFYEEFKDKLDWDPFFVQEYGYEDDEDEESDEESEYYNDKHAKEWMEKHPYGYYNNEEDYGLEEAFNGEEIFIHVFDIDYYVTEEDVDDESEIEEIKASLPQDLYFTIDVDFEDEYELEERIVDAISDETGWLVETFDYETLSEKEWRYYSMLKEAKKKKKDKVRFVGNPEAEMKFFNMTASANGGEAVSESNEEPTEDLYVTIESGGSIGEIAKYGHQRIVGKPCSKEEAKEKTKRMSKAYSGGYYGYKYVTKPLLWAISKGIYKEGENK